MGALARIFVFNRKLTRENMKVIINLSLLMFAILTSSKVISAPIVDHALVGKWNGERGPETTCEYLAWTSTFTEDGKFSITFYNDHERKEEIATEGGVWQSGNGSSKLITKGVPTPEIYLYTIIDADTIKYVNTVRDPLADCKDDYEFTEHRVK